jgi:glycerol uptake facilitator protein
MNAYLAEFIGTTLLILFGNGVVANVVLARTKGHNAGWIVITAGWGIAVYIGAFCSDKFSGAHLNPAVSVAMAFADPMKWPMEKLFGYIGAQMAGGIVGGALVFLFYREHFKASTDADGKLACFCTAANIRNHAQSFFCEVIGTFALILPIFLMVAPSFTTAGADVAQPPVLGLGTLGLLPVALLVFGIGLSLGGTTGYAINPARDLGPRLAHFFLPIPGKRDSDWGYAWVPVFGPIVGALLAAWVHLCLK